MKKVVWDKLGPGDLGSIEAVGLMGRDTLGSQMADGANEAEAVNEVNQANEAEGPDEANGANEAG